MATRYWVGGTGFWDASSTANWSTTSGGASGASAPTSADDVIFDNSSGSFSYQIYPTAATCLNFTATGTNNHIFDFLYGTTQINVFGSISVNSETTFVNASTTGGVTLKSSVAGRTITIPLSPSLGSIIQNIIVSPTGAGTYLLAANIVCDNFTITGAFSTNNFRMNCNITHTAGTFTATGASSSIAGSYTYSGGTFSQAATSFFTNCTVVNSSASLLTLNKIQQSMSMFGGTGGITVTAASTVLTANFYGKINFSSTLICNGDGLFDITTGTMSGAITFNTVGLITCQGATFGAITFNNYGSITGFGTFGAVTSGTGFDALISLTGTGTSSFGAINATAASSLVFNASAHIGNVSCTSTIAFPSVSTNQLYGPTGANRLTITGVVTMPTVVQMTGNITFSAATTFTGGADINSALGNTGQVIFTALPTFPSAPLALLVNTRFNTASTFTINTDQIYFLASISTGSVTFNASSLIQIDGSTLGGTTTLTRSDPTSLGGAFINGTNTFNNLTLTSATGGARQFLFQNTFVTTITGTLSAVGSSGINRIQIASATTYASTTIIANAVSLTDVDFIDITTGGSATWSGTRIGNVGGNSGITFTPTKNVFLVGTTSYAVTAGYALTSGGAANTTNFPLAQDNMYVDSNSGNSGITVTFSSNYIYPNIIATSRTTPITLSNDAVLYLNKELTLSATTTLSGTGTLSLIGRANYTITTAGSSINSYTTISTSGTYTLADSLVIINATGLQVTGNLNLGTSNLVTTALSYFSGTFTYNTQSIVQITGSNGLNFDSTVVSLVGTGKLTFNFTYAGAGTVTCLLTSTEATSSNVNFLAGTYTLTLNNSFVNNIDFTGFSGNVAATGSFTVYGNYTSSSTMTYNSSATAVINFKPTSGSKILITNGKSFLRSVSFQCAGASYSLIGALDLGGSSTTVLTLTSGTLNLSGFATTCGTFVSSNSNVRTLDFAGATLTINGSGSSAFSAATSTNFTVLGGGTISMISSSSKTFSGGGNTYPITLNQGGSGTLDISGSNTFSNIANTIRPSTVRFVASSVTTLVDDFDLNGISGSLVLITTTSGAGTFTLTKSSGTISTNYLNLQRSTATGGAIWYAGADSTDGGNNTGWIFSTYSGNSSGFLAFF